MRKLVDIAMALVRRPKLLLLDEPTSGVSAEEKFATMDRVIHAVAPDAATIVFVEHDMEIVSRYADRVVAFYRAASSPTASPRHVLKDPEVRRYVTGRRANERQPPLLEIDDLVVEIQSMPALRGFSMRVATRRDGEPGRPQRRRQDHADALDHGTSQAGAAAPSGSRAPTWPRGRVTPAPRSGSATCRKTAAWCRN